VGSGIRDALAGTPAASRAPEVADAVTNGQISGVLAHAPASARQVIGQAATSSFVDALNHITTIAAVIALVAGVCCLFLIRARDFVDHQGPAARDTGVPKGGKHRASPKRAAVLTR
jgi:hypothetical protein